LGHEKVNQAVGPTYITCRAEKGHAAERVPLKIIWRHMDCCTDCLYRVKLEAPIMEGY